MSSAPRGDAVDLGNVYSDLAAALGAAHHQSTFGDGSPERLAAVNQAVQQLWSRTVQRLGAGMEHADLSGIPPVVEPDLEAPAELDVDAILDHVAEFEPAPAVTPQQPWSPFGWAISVRTAALVWCAVAAVLAVVLGLTVAGPVVVPAFIPPIATGLLLAWRGVGRAPGVLWAIGLAPLVNALPPLVSPGRGGLFQGLGSSGGGSSGDGLRYCWTCHMKTQHKSAGFALPICQRCVSKADTSTSGRTFSQSCPICRGRTPHTDDGTCLSCWKKGR